MVSVSAALLATRPLPTQPRWCPTVRANTHMSADMQQAALHENPALSPTFPKSRSECLVQSRQVMKCHGDMRERGRVCPYIDQVCCSRSFESNTVLHSKRIDSTC